MNRSLLALVLAATALGACQRGAEPAVENSLDEIAREFVLLSLTIGEKEEGYIDAYYGPAELLAKAKADAAGQDLNALARRTDELRKKLEGVASGDPMEARRAKFLAAQLAAAATRLRMLNGEKLSFQEEAKGLFGVAPELKPLNSYDPVLARIDQLVPGSGDLADRVDAFQNRFNIPKERLKPVFDAAIGDCSRRTIEHIQMPKGERFDMTFVTGKSWSGYNYYQGNAHSRIEINTDLPIRISRAVDLGCHEGYPGHHVLNALLEQRLTKDKGWIEFSVYPLYSPQSLIAEGSANYGIELAFPGRERLDYETAALYPLAGLPVADAGRYFDLMRAIRDLSGARFTIVSDYLEGKIDRAEAVRLTRKYQLQSQDRAEQSMDFADQYRSYVINYGLGQDMVRAYVEAAGSDPKARWARMEKILSEPTLPSDLKP